MPRNRLPSLPEMDERLTKLEEEVTGSHHVPLTKTSTPPPVRTLLDWMQRKAFGIAVKIVLAALLGAATWYGGWLAKDCQHGRVPTAYPASGTLK